MIDLSKQLKSLAALAVIASPCTAYAGEWKYAATIYLFTPETTTAIGGVETTLSFSDALDNLDFAFMGAFEATMDAGGSLPIIC